MSGELKNYFQILITGTQGNERVIEKGKNHLITLDILYPFSHLASSFFIFLVARQQANSITNSDVPFPGSSIKLFSVLLAHEKFCFFLYHFTLHKSSFFSSFQHRIKIRRCRKTKNSNKLHFAHIWFDYNLCGLEWMGWCLSWQCFWIQARKGVGNFLISTKVETFSKFLPQVKQLKTLNKRSF